MKKKHVFLLMLVALALAFATSYFGLLDGVRQRVGLPEEDQSGELTFREGE